WPAIVFNEVAGSLQVFIRVLVFFLHVIVCDKLANATAESVVHVIPDEPKLALRLIQESCFDFFTVQAPVVFREVIKIRGACDLKEIWEVSGYFGYPFYVAFERYSRGCRRSRDQLNCFASGECAKKHVGENIEER